MIIRETFPVGPLGCNCSLLVCDETLETVVVDPGGDPEFINDAVRRNNLTVKAIVHTHAHFDHVMGTREVKRESGGEICLHQGDAFLYDHLPAQAQHFGLMASPADPVDRWISHRDIITFGKGQAEVIHTPGHTPGSVCFQVHDQESDQTVVLAGDTLFRRGIGRTDLPGGDARKILESIRERLWTLRPDALVIPGHGAVTTIHEEKRHNPFVGE